MKVAERTIKILMASATLAFNSNEAKKGLYNAEIKWTLTSRINEGAK